MIDSSTLYIKENFESKHRFAQAQREKLNKEREQIRQRISRLYDDHYDGNILADFFNSKLKEYKEREQEISKELSNIHFRKF